MKEDYLLMKTTIFGHINWKSADASVKIRASLSHQSTTMHLMKNITLWCVKLLCSAFCSVVGRRHTDARHEENSKNMTFLLFSFANLCSLIFRFLYPVWDKCHDDDDLVLIVCPTQIPFENIPIVEARTWYARVAAKNIWYPPRILRLWNYKRPQSNFVCLIEKDFGYDLT